MPVDKFGRMSDTKTKDTGVSLTYIDNNYIRSDGVGEITGNLNMASHTIENLGNPTKPKDAVTKEYADQVGGGSPFLTENGDYKATHTINMAYNKLLNLHKPIDLYDAATKDYVDYVNNARSHIIAVHAKYYGRLEKDHFQFTFGGNTIQPYVNNINNGFLIPQSGRIKKIVLKDYGYKFYFKDWDDLGVRILYSSGLTTPIFTIILIKKEEVSELTTYKCTFKVKERSNLGEVSMTDCIFTPDPRNIPISEGDILNIRTEVNNIPNASDSFKMSRHPNFNTDKTKDDFFTYLFTFLIELDPL